ncbi:hypothetical protein [Pseudomonas sp. OV226]|uniref:hypothetical protein n=1 Tax=Pseudomonas sp. OV226 TaxID=2135588 RepID=UPI000D6B9763|nr:hypothetical protein [Pseudomonas sp. OV226]PWK44805.1 hypothetical protein C7534_102364 [Pseudomonas sp. OV226]
MKHTIQHLILTSCLALNVGCAATGKSDSFTFTPDFPPSFKFSVLATYVPAKGETCTVPGGKNTQLGFNMEGQEYKPAADIVLHRTVSGCPLALHLVEIKVTGIYGEDWGDRSSDTAWIAVRNEALELSKGTFNAAGESQISGQCQWLFRTVGGLRRIVKILDCKNADAQGNLSKGHPFAAYTLDQLPGKTVRLKIKLAEEEKPAIGDTWVQVPGGWKRCMGDNFADQYAFCYGNYTDFSTFRMPDGRDTCTIYPGCTENKEVTP